MDGIDLTDLILLINPYKPHTVEYSVSCIPSTRDKIGRRLMGKIPLMRRDPGKEFFGIC